MSNWRHPSSVISFYCLLAGVGALLLVPVIFETPTGQAGGFLPGYSAARITLGVSLSVLAFSLIGIAIKAAGNRIWAEKLWRSITDNKNIVDGIMWGSALSFIIGWILCFTPSYAVSEVLAGYLVRLRPIVIWLTSLSGVTLVILLVQRYGWHPEEFLSDLSLNKQVFKVGMSVLGFLLLLLGLVSLTGIGIRVREDYWYGPGVPILGLQLLLAFVLGGLALWWEKKQKLDRQTLFRRDLVICAVFWILTALLWSNEPLRPSFFLPGPSRPNHEFYPFSDAATFDSYSQFALIGQGLVNGLPLDRALYPIFLILMHALGGQDFQRLMALQAAIFAGFPVILYLLGKELHSRAAGISAGLLISMRGLNAILGSAWIDSAGPKMPLTDFPAAIGIALIALLAVHWMKDPVRNRKYALWAGAVIGLTIMLRTNTLLLVPFLLLYALTAHAGQYKRWFLASSLLLAAMLVTTLPWDLRNHSQGSPMFSLYFGRIQTILATRYSPAPIPAPAPTGTPNNANFLRTAPAAQDLFQDNFTYSSRFEIQAISDACRSSIACSIYNNYFHNLVTAVLILPTSPVLDDLRHTIKSETPYWQPDWQGQNISPSAGLFLVVNLMLIALGVGAAWGHVRFPALIPLLIFFVYAASNALARTSGGRYIVPMEWVICLYFVFGVFEIFHLSTILFGAKSGIEPAEHKNILRSRPSTLKRSNGQIIYSLIVVFAIGSWLPASEWIYPRRYQAESAQQILTRLEASGLLKQAGVERDTLSSFLSDPQARALTGRALYPRYYKIGGGEAPNDYPYAILNFPRLVFSVIGPIPASNAYEAHGVILPLETVPSFSNAVDVVVLGCQAESYLEAWMVFVLGEQNSVLVRSPLAALSCPLQQPVCDDNHNCR